jgi:hypothetical protein
VNHCAYVSSVANLGTNRSLSYINELGDIRSKNDIWHYRFEDTVAVHFTFQVIYAVRARGLKYFTSPQGAVECKRLCHLLGDARRYLDRAVPYFNDPEFVDHEQRVTTLQANLGCELRPQGST